MLNLDTLNFDNTYARLPEAFYSRVLPTAIPQPYLVSFNADAASLIDLNPAAASSPSCLQYFSGASVPPGADPLAMLYAGHQFGHFVPQLGDGRAILLGEVRNAAGENWDLQLKGSGLTPYSRDGDGRAVLRSTIREYLCSEAMHGLGIPTTRALCIVGSDMEVFREEIETAAMLIRMSPSHVRFGSFEVFFYRGQQAQVKILADYVIAKHFPEWIDQADKYPRLLREVTSRTARLIAKWQAVGFAHGVMNTDNMSILGLTLDYGPYGFMESYDHGFVCNHSDHGGRYAFDQQPDVGGWNVRCLAQALTPLMTIEEATDAISVYQTAFVAHYIELMSQKLGLRDSSGEVVPLITGLLDIMHASHVDYTQFFRVLGNFEVKQQNASLRDMFIDRLAFDQWAQNYGARLSQENRPDAERKVAMNAVNPCYILRNYFAQIAIDKAKIGDYSEIDTLLGVLKTPFTEQTGMSRYAALPPEGVAPIQVSCSS